MKHQSIWTLIPAMAIALIRFVNPASSESKPLHTVHSYPVNLQCPEFNNGLLQLILMTTSGATERFRVYYYNHKAVRFEVANAPKNGKFLDLIVKITKDKKKEDFRILAQRANRLLTRVCNASDIDRKKYFQLLEKNKAELLKYDVKP